MTDTYWWNDPLYRPTEPQERLSEEEAQEQGQRIMEFLVGPNYANPGPSPEQSRLTGAYKIGFEAGWEAALEQEAADAAAHDEAVAEEAEPSFEKPDELEFDETRLGPAGGILSKVSKFLAEVRSRASSLFARLRSRVWRS